MTDDKLTNLSRALGFALAVGLFVLIAIGWACGQDVPETKFGNKTHQHKDKALEGLNNRVTVAQILWMEPMDGGWRLETKAQDKYEIRHEFFQVTKTADVDAEILAKPKGKYVFIVWCGDDRFVYLVTAVKPQNIAKR